MARPQRLLLRVRPYKNLENKIDGAVMALFDLGASQYSPLGERRI